ncbi:MAG: transporter, family, lincomycin resistance protein [Clostridiales bacterium]|nr:transporter, family, lincomycin resistance protein [Clostridiales bacterium]
MEKTNRERSATEQGINTIAIVIVLVLSAFLGLFNETMLNVALNSLMEEMHVNAGMIQWIITAYMIIVAVMVPVTAFFIQTFEVRKLYLGAMSVLLLGTIGAALSSSFVALLIFRMIQAVGTGMMVSIMMTIVLLVTPPEKRGSAMGICSCAIQLGPALGPTFSGVILQFFSWHMLFYILIPIIVGLMVAGYVYLLNVTTLTKPKTDFISIVLSTVGVGGVIYGLNAFSEGIHLIMAVGTSIIGLSALVIFGMRQLKLNEPMLELRIFKYRIFSIGAVLVMISMMTIFTMNVMLPMYLQGSLKTTAFMAALILLPATLTNGAMSLLSGKIYDKIGSKILLSVGYAILLVALIFMSRANAETPPACILGIYIAVGIGIGSTLSPSQTHALNQLSRHDYPHGVAILNTLQQIAAAIGSALFIGIMSASELRAINGGAEKTVANAVGFHSALMVMLIFSVLGILLSFLLQLGNKTVQKSYQSV